MDKIKKDLTEFFAGWLVKEDSVQEKDRVPFEICIKSIDEQMMILTDYFPQVFVQINFSFPGKRLVLKLDSVGDVKCSEETS